MEKVNIYNAKTNLSKLVQEVARTGEPFDRLIVAQAKHEQMPLVTSDGKLIESVNDYITVIANR